MAEYIERDDVLSNADIITVQTREYGNIDVVPVEYLADLPTADVVEVKHGEWIFDEKERRYRCSACKNIARSGNAIYHNENLFCGHCGAKMDGENNV